MKKTLTILLLLLPLFAMAQKKMSDSETLLRKLLVTETAIKQLYVDTVNENALIESAVRGMLKDLDPHSQYTPAKDVQALNEPLQGSFEGIGVQYNMNEDTLVVIQPTTGGPSEKVGIIAGDKIVTVNDTSIAGVKMSREEIMKRLRGPKGTKVNLGIVRQGVSGTQKFTVTRDKIPVHTVDAYYMIDETIGYVRISSYGATTCDEFRAALEDLKQQGMKDLMLDLQGNGGGYLQAAVDMGNMFLNEGDTIVYTEGRVVGKHVYKARKDGYKFLDGKIVVLVDGYTASAAEIVSGAIQDNDRGVIVGRRTFAKGLVQRPIDLPDGSLIRLTVAHYYSPVGRCFQKPYVKGDRKSYDSDMMNRLNSGELMSADSIHFPDSLKYTTRGGRTVYGGGGIMPDVYVPLDTTLYTRLHRELSAKSCIIQTTLRYLDRHRKALSKEYNIDAYRKARTKKLEGKKYNEEDLTAGFVRFNQEFEVPQEEIDIMLKLADDAKVKYDDATLTETLPMVKIQLKALLARDLWDMPEYFRIINPTNEIFNEGLKAMKSEE